MILFDRMLAANLREARKQAGFSLSKLEEDTEGVFKASAVGAYERGERAISVAKFGQLCRVYDTTAKEVIPFG